ncbi:hypothetical protein D3C71_896800 [compost metagenome]
MAETAHDEIGYADDTVIAVMAQLRVAAERHFGRIVVGILAHMRDQRTDAVDLKVELIGGDVTENQRRHVVPVTQCNSKAQCHSSYSCQKMLMY